jgi:hypothetical protein
MHDDHAGGLNSILEVCVPEKIYISANAAPDESVLHALSMAESMGSFCHIPQRFTLMTGKQGHQHHSQQNHQHRHKQISIGDLLQDLGDLLHGRGDDDNAYAETVGVGDGHGSHKALILI